MLKCGLCLILNPRQPYAALGVRVNNPLLKAVNEIVTLRKSDAFRTMALAVESCLNTILGLIKPFIVVELVLNGAVRSRNR